MKITRKQLRTLIEGVLNEQLYSDDSEYKALDPKIKSLLDDLVKTMEKVGADPNFSVHVNKAPSYINVKNGVYLGRLEDMSGDAALDGIGGEPALRAILSTLRKKHHSNGAHLLASGPNENGEVHLAAALSASGVGIEDASSDRIADLDGDGDVDAADFFTPRPAKNAKGRRGRMSGGDVYKRTTRSKD